MLNNNQTTNTNNTPAQLFKEFYKAEKGAPAFLHNFAGLDFCAPYILRKLNTPTTYRAIFDALNIPHTGEGWQVFAFFTDNKTFYCKKDFKVIKINSINYIDVDLKPYRYTDNAPDNFYRKSDAEQARKACGIMWIVAQKDEHTTAPRGEKFNRPQIDPRERYNLKSVDYCHTQTGAKYINRLHLTDRKTGAGVCFELGTRCYTHREQITPDALPAVIDKSGFLTYNRRADLNRRAQALRAKRQKAQADQINALCVAKCLTMTCETVKNKLVEILPTLHTSHELHELGNICSGWFSGLAGLLDDLERFTEKATEKTFTSPEQIAKKAEEIRQKAREITEKLNALSVAGV